MGKKDSQGKTYAEKDLDERMKSGSPTFKDIGESFVTKGKPYNQRGALSKAAGPTFRDIYDKAKDGKKAPYNQKKPVNPMDEEDYGPTPPDIADKLQTMKNIKGAENYEATKEYKKGGKVGSASKRADGCCTKGKTKGRML